MNVKEALKKLAARVRESFHEATFVVDGEEMTSDDMYEHAKRWACGTMNVDGLDVDVNYFIDASDNENRFLKALAKALLPVLAVFVVNMTAFWLSGWVVSWWTQILFWDWVAMLVVLIIVSYRGNKIEAALRAKYPVGHDLFHDTAMANPGMAKRKGANRP